jgi:hypothetical protein
MGIPFVIVAVNSREGKSHDTSAMCRPVRTGRIAVLHCLRRCTEDSLSLPSASRVNSIAPDTRGSVHPMVALEQPVADWDDVMEETRG